MARSFTERVAENIRSSLGAGTLRNMRSLAPVDTGRLRNSIRGSVREHPSGLSVEVELADYHIYVNAAGQNRKLSAAILSLLVQDARAATSQAFSDWTEENVRQQIVRIQRNLQLNVLNGRGIF